MSKSEGLKPLLDIQNTVHKLEDYYITNNRVVETLIKINDIDNKQHSANMRFMKGFVLVLLAVILMFAGKDLGVFSAFCRLFGF